MDNLQTLSDSVSSLESVKLEKEHGILKNDYKHISSKLRNVANRINLMIEEMEIISKELNDTTSAFSLMIRKKKLLSEKVSNMIDSQIITDSKNKTCIDTASLSDLSDLSDNEDVSNDNNNKLHNNNTSNVEPSTDNKS